MHINENSKVGGKKKSSTGGVRTHADINPLDLKSNALTTRPPYFDTIPVKQVIIYKINSDAKTQTNRSLSSYFNCGGIYRYLHMLRTN